MGKTYKENDKYPRPRVPIRAKPTIPHKNKKDRDKWSEDQCEQEYIDDKEWWRDADDLGD